jgi:hypothetical protein
VTALRIVAAPRVGPAGFSGEATVVDVAGERINLDLGQGRMLTFVARAEGSPIRTAIGDRVQVEYRVRSDPFDRQQVLAVRTQSGGGIVSVLESGTMPVTVSVRLFGLVARQAGEANRGTMDVDVRVGEDPATRIKSGAIVRFRGLAVGLRASTARANANPNTLEGNPYSIDLVAWPLQ